MFKNESTNKLMSMAVVAMMMLCAFSVCLVAGEDDATDANGAGTSDNPYIINIRTGQEFTYKPTTNLTSTITMVGTHDGATWSDSEGLKYAPTAVPAGGSETIQIQANWHQGSLTQTASQYIKFNVYKPIELVETLSGEELNSASTRTINVVIGNDKTVFNGYAYTISKGESGSDATLTTSGFASGLFTFETQTDGSVLLKQNNAAVANDKGTYEGSVTVTSNVANNTQSKTLNIKINVVDKIAVVTTVDTFETFVGATGNVGGSTNSMTPSATVPTSDDFTTAVTYAVTAPTTPANFFSVTGNNSASATVAWNTNNSENTTTTGSKTYKFSVTATGTYTPVDTALPAITSTSDAAEFTVIVYDKLVFMDAPQIPTFAASTGQGAFANDVTVSASFIAAKKIVYNWGDGTSTSTNVAISDVAKNYSAHHIYATAGSYQVSITAINDMGETTSHLLVTANGFGDAAPESDYTITVKDKTGANILGYFYVNEGQKLADVEFTPAEGVSFDAATQKLTALFENAATGSAALGGKTADLCAVVTSDDIYYAEIVEKGFFDYHGWDFILFAVLAILSIVVYLYFYCHPAMPVLAIVFAILAVASYLCGGITEIIPALQAAWNSWFPPAQ